VGYPRSAKYTIASGNLLADLRFNVSAESQRRLHVTRLYSLTENQGVKPVLSVMIALDTMRQNQWPAAIKEPEADGFETAPRPSNFPQTWRTSASAPVPDLFGRDGKRPGPLGAGPHAIAEVRAQVAEDGSGPGAGPLPACQAAARAILTAALAATERAWSQAGM
jgi:Mn-containing catalase